MSYNVVSSPPFSPSSLLLMSLKSSLLFCFITWDICAYHCYQSVTEVASHFILKLIQFNSTRPCRHNFAPFIAACTTVIALPQLNRHCKHNDFVLCCEFICLLFFVFFFLLFKWDLGLKACVEISTMSVVVETRGCVFFLLKIILSVVWRWRWSFYFGFKLILWHRK